MKPWLFGLLLLITCIVFIASSKWPYTVRTRAEINRIVSSPDALAGIKDLNLDHTYRLLPIDILEKLKSQEVLDEARSSLGIYPGSMHPQKTKINARLVTGSTIIELIGIGDNREATLALTAAVFPAFNRIEKRKSTNLSQTAINYLESKRTALIESNKKITFSRKSGDILSETFATSKNLLYQNPEREQIYLLAKRIEELKTYKAMSVDKLITIDSPHLDNSLRENQKRIAMGFSVLGSVLISLSLAAIREYRLRTIYRG